MDNPKRLLVYGFYSEIPLWNVRVPPTGHHFFCTRRVGMRPPEGAVDETFLEIGLDAYCYKHLFTNTRRDPTVIRLENTVPVTQVGQ